MLGSKIVIGSRWIKPVKSDQTGFVLLSPPLCKTHQITIDFAGFYMPEGIRGHLLVGISLEEVGGVCK